MRDAAATLWNVGRCALDIFTGSLTVSLAPSLVRGADLVLLLVQIVAPLVGPASRLFTGLTRALFDRVTAFFSDLANTLARLVAGLWSIKNSHRRTDTQASQEPQETTSEEHTSELQSPC